MQDVSNLLPGGPISCLVPTSQHAGNQVWANNAHTAPGGASGDLGNNLNQAVVVPAPTVEAQVHEVSVNTRGDDSGPAGGKPVLKMGQWNDFGGGSGPNAR